MQLDHANTQGNLGSSVRGGFYPCFSIASTVLAVSWVLVFCFVLGFFFKVSSGRGGLGSEREWEESQHCLLVYL